MKGNPTYDVAVIGGGASGLAAALTVANSGSSAVVLERDVACGLPILATGNGRCNLSNESLDPAHYRHQELVRTVFGERPEHELASFFSSVGIITDSEQGRLYPLSRRAESVRDALLSSCARAKVSLRCACDLARATWSDSARRWTLDMREPARDLHGKAGHNLRADIRAKRKNLSAVPMRDVSLTARSVIIACGGNSGEMARMFSLPHRDETPLLCPLACDVPKHPSALTALDGLRLEADLTLLRHGQCLWQEQGEVLFRPYGISGIAAFNLSRRIQPGDTLRIWPFPGMDEHEVDALLERRAATIGSIESLGATWFDGLFARPLAALLITLGRDNGAPFARYLTLEVSGTAETQVAQVRRGGIPFESVRLPSMRLIPNGPSSTGPLLGKPLLFGCGEALDMDADCGGFNLAWAWLSGIRAAQGAIAELA